MCTLLIHSSENGSLEGLQIFHCQKQTFERSKICQQTCCSSSRLSDFQNSYSFELRDSVFGSLPFSEFKKFVRFERIRPLIPGETLEPVFKCIFIWHLIGEEDSCSEG